MFDGVRRSAVVVLGFGRICAGCADADPVTMTFALSDLAVEGVALVPAFSPEIARFRGESGLLTRSPRLSARVTPPALSIEVSAGGDRLPIEVLPDGAFAAALPLALGENEFELVVRSRGGERRYELAIARHAEPWRSVQVLALDPPVENAYFGDYLRASRDFLYVNASRRGRLYEKSGPTWVFARPSEELFSVELEWMFEAAITNDALAIIGQPLGGEETLFAFSLGADGNFSPAGEHATATQGTVRLLGDDLVFVGPDRIEFFRRENGTFSHQQTLGAPSLEIGFGLRPTYFDAPGVALSADTLVVGAPLDSSPGTGVSATFDPTTSDDARESGVVLVYERDAEGTWALSASLKPPEVAPDLRFGHAAAIAEDLIAVGAPREGSAMASLSAEQRAVICAAPAPDCAPEAGAVYLFERVAVGWASAGMLKASVIRPYDYFGDELVLVGDTVLVGAPGQDSAQGAPPSDDQAPESGGVFVFVRESGGLRELGLHKLPRALEAPFPFPDALQHAGGALAAASNTAPTVTPGGVVTENAGRAYYLYW